MIDITKHTLSNTASIKTGITKINELNGLVVFIIDANQVVLGTITDGDIRRGLLNDLSLEDSIEKVMYQNFRFIKNSNFSLTTINEYKKLNLSIIPVIDEEGKLVKIIDLTTLRSVIPVEVLLMAGGKGERLRPLTDSLPKPLLMVGDKPIIEHNIDRLSLYGVEKLTISVKYKAEMIENYFKDGSEKGLSINYIHENEPLGTLGSISLIDTIQTDAILVMNSDLLTNIDFEDFYAFFEDKKADMAVASIPYRVEIPYGVLETNGDQIINLKEKPSYTYYSNAGIYLIKTNMLSKIPKNTFFNATDLIHLLMADKKSVVNYPIINYWLDIGKHDDYEKAQEDIKHISL